MSFLTDIIGGSAAKPVEAVGNALNGLFTSDDERLTHAEVMERIKQQPELAQIDLNKAEAAHRSVFVAGWRPFIGWVCGLGLACKFIVYPIASTFGQSVPILDDSGLMSLTLALLGLGGLRTYEKKKGLSK